MLDSGVADREPQEAGMVSTIAPWAEPVPGVERVVTADELLHWPEDPRFPWQYELVAGRLVRMAPTGGEHSDVAGNFYFALRSFSKAHGGVVTAPETGFRLTSPGEEDTVLASDAAYLSPARAAQLPPSGSPERKQYFRVPPDLAVEVASPDQHRPELAAKARLYLAAGVQMVLIAWPGRREVDVWRPGSGEPVATLGINDVLDGLDVVPGFVYRVADLFA